MALIDHETGRQVAQEWLDAFNAHDAERVVRHFADDVTATSPVIAALRPASGGTLKGKADVLSYYQEGLRLDDDVHFTVIEVLCGVDQITIVYRNHSVSIWAAYPTGGTRNEGRCHNRVPHSNDRRMRHGRRRIRRCRS